MNDTRLLIGAGARCTDGACGRLQRGIIDPDHMRLTYLAVGPDGAVFVADQGAGGVQIYEPDGRFRGRVGRAGDGDEDFAGLTRIARGAGGELYALDDKHRRIHRFDRFQHRLPTWPITGDPKLAPVDLAVHLRGLLLLMANGIIQIYDATGLAREAMPPLKEAGLVPDPGEAGSLNVDGGGEIVVAYPASGTLARYSPQGAVSGARGSDLRAGALWTADGAGRTYELDDNGDLCVHDAEGWRVARLGGLGKKVVAIAASPDGQTVAGIDSKRQAVVRLRPSNPKEAPLVFGQPGKNNGQFDNPIALAVDEAGRTYVLDDGLYRVSVFDDKGSFLFAFGSYGKDGNQLKEPKLIAVSAAGDAAYVYDDDKYEVKKFALDQKAATGTHVTNSGGKGDGPGQLRSVVGMGCDRQGLLYLADDSRGDLQALDFRGNSAVALVARKFGDYGIRTVAGLTVAPDGQPWLFGKGTLSGARWTDRKP
jgi:sugar lactone lactonase YvrE